jgi:hypothetical protein
MTSALAKNNYGNGSGNGNRILSPIINWKSNNKPEEMNMKGWVLRGAAAGVGIAASVASVDLLKNWWSKEEVKSEANEREEEARRILALVKWLQHKTTCRSNSLSVRSRSVTESSERKLGEFVTNLR